MSPFFRTYAERVHVSLNVVHVRDVPVDLELVNRLRCMPSDDAI